MRHRKLRHRLGVNKEHRYAILRNMSASVIKHNKITTTNAKAKALKRYFDKMITAINKYDDDFNRIRMAKKWLNHNLIQEVKKIALYKPKSRTSGHLSVKKIGHRVGDAADISSVKWLN